MYRTCILCNTPYSISPIKVETLLKQKRLAEFLLCEKCMGRSMKSLSPEELKIISTLVKGRKKQLTTIRSEYKKLMIKRS